MKNKLYVVILTMFSLLVTGLTVWLVYSVQFLTERRFFALFIVSVMIWILYLAVLGDILDEIKEPEK